MFDLTGVDHRVSAAYHPQTNGLDERFNQTLINSLIKMAGEKSHEWDEYIDAVLFAYRSVVLYIILLCLHSMRAYNYRTSQQASSQFTPFELLYKRKPRLPAEVDKESDVKEVIYRITRVPWLNGQNVSIRRQKGILRKLRGSKRESLMLSIDHQFSALEIRYGFITVEKIPGKVGN